MSRFFDQMNELGDRCPLCKTRDEGQILLVPILGTEEGNNVQASQVHRRCAAEVFDAYLYAIRAESDG